MKIDEAAFEAATWNYNDQAREIARRTIEKYLAALTSAEPGRDRISAPEGKQRVRVLVGVAQDGDWYASGRERTRSAEGHTRRNAIDAALGFGAQFRWIEADVTPWQPPTEETVQGREVVP